MKFGVCYYPEHWPTERWETDARLMVEAGISLVRLGEFAWAQIEPASGHYHWDWLDQSIGVLAAAGLEIVLGTPSATPPAWLCQAHPNILPVNAAGQKRGFGSRRHYCPTSPIYRTEVSRIVTMLAQRYGEHPGVVGWQVDNELGDHDTARCYCQQCTAGFQSWLKQKYGTLEALNAAWGAVFWSQSYSDWQQIGLPAGTVTAINPSHALDYYRFASDMMADFSRQQVEILRRYAPGRKITTNFMGTFSDLDSPVLAQPLDFASWDSYPTGNAEVMAERLYSPGEMRPPHSYDTGDPYATAIGHDLTRGLKGGLPFWIMEQQAGNINWSIYNTGVRPGNIRLWTWHAAASGAEAVVYFRWRASLFAQEQYHSGLLHHDASPAQGYQELLDMQSEREALNAVTSSPFDTPVALLLDYADLWAVDLQPHRRDFTYLRHFFRYYRALLSLGMQPDIVYPGQPLDRYRLVIAPTAHLAGEDRAQLLHEYVAQGGTLLLGIRSGFKTPSNLVTSAPLPGALRDLVGASVRDWHALPPDVGYDLAENLLGLAGRVDVWAEALAPDPEAQVLVAYSSGPFAGRAALTMHPVGAGQVCYAGFYPTPVQAQGLVAYLAQSLDLPYLVGLPAGMLAVRRGSALVLLNFTDAPQTLRLGDNAYTVPDRDVLYLPTL
jgi:beta-galactosidase